MEKNKSPRRPHRPRATSTACPGCQKSLTQCVCAWIQPQRTRLSVLILQHPQEPRQPLSTAYMAHRCLTQSRLKQGLSWPNLSAAWGSSSALSPSEWGVFYWGTAQQWVSKRELLLFLGKTGQPRPAPVPLKGVVLLDGTWSQAKTLWWRNPWLLKLTRIALFPSTPSLYAHFRREPRKECLSSLETLALALPLLGEPLEVREGLLQPFRQLLEKQVPSHQQGKTS